ncbi:putative membrane protein [Burkholderia pseudomallei TSV28]|uniref:hypothetical protein n=1 Tax=Burkholderia pseudomallei TaxID=28450 RepID=UPI000538CA44|nr:hypothetical protein [Burkholderia pseudomallei]KGX69265.1 putative membrane protein [Burkholderia pseudomallei TSV28]
MNDEQNTAPNWLQEGDLLYRLTIDTHRQNHDEIYVTLAEGSRDIRARAARAAELREALKGLGSNGLPDGTSAEALTKLRRLIAADGYAVSFRRCSSIDARCYGRSTTRAPFARPRPR